ncbi:MAG: Na/Pi symporter, partial [Gammaproteobacteria bacterium]|nr:Na/Pi symporter [Gammaproteobacteria bacterium]
NIGTTATALIAVFNMDLAAKKTAFSHFLFNVGGVVVFAPVILLFIDRITSIEMDPEIVLAGVHLVFNLATSLLFIVFINPFTRFVDMVLGEGKGEFERVGLPSFNADAEFEEIRAEINENLGTLLEFLQENYNLVTLSIETNYRGIYETSAKRIEYVEFLKNEYMGYFSKVIGITTCEDESKVMLSLITRFDYLFQIHDSIDDLFATKRVMNANFIELKSDILLLIRELAGQTLALFDEIHKSISGVSETNISATARDLQRLLDRVNRDMLRLLAEPGRRDAGSLTNIVTYSIRLKDKLVNFAHIEAAHTSSSAASKT